MALFDFLEKKIDNAKLDALGIGLSDKTVAKELAFFIAVSYYAATISNCEFKTYEDGKEVRNELYYMLNLSPNPNQNASQFKKKLVESYFYDTETLLVPITNKWRVYVADGFSKEEKPLAEDIFTNVSVKSDTFGRAFKASDVFYFEQEDRDVRLLVNQLNKEYGALLSAAFDAYKRGNSAKYKLVLENTEAGDQKFAKQYREVIKAQLETFLNADKAVFPQFRGQSLEKMETGGTTSSADVVAIRKEIFETVAQAFKIPLSMMYGNITNVNDIVKSFLTFGVDPVAKMLETEITRKMYPYQKWKDGNYVKVDTSRVNHMSILEVADKVDKAIGSGFANIDDMRKQVDWEPLDTEFSKAHFITKNYAPADTALDPLEGGEKNEE